MELSIVRACYTIPLSSSSRITVNQRKLTTCTKKKPKRTDVTISVWTKHTMHQRLHDAADQNRDCQRIHQGAAHIAYVQPKNDCAKNRQILNAVCVCPHGAFVPIGSLNLIGAELAYCHTSRQNPTPTVYPDCSEQQQHGPSGESDQHP